MKGVGLSFAIEPSKIFMSTDHDWDEWRFNFSHEQLIPGHVPEEGLLLHVLGVALARSQSTVRIFAQQLQEQARVRITASPLELCLFSTDRIYRFV